MAWVNRFGFYYRCQRTPAGPRNTYLGHGLVGQLAAAQDVQRAEHAALEAIRRRQERQHERDLDEGLDTQYGELRKVVRAHLVASGWYSHKREWRQRIDLEQNSMTEALTRAEIEALAGGKLESLIERCNVAKPKASDLAALRKVVNMPSVAIMRALSGTVLAEDIIGGSGAVKVVTDAELMRMRRDLAGDDCHPVESALVDHVVTCWARLQIAERRLTTATSGSHMPDEGIYWERRVSLAQSRYLRAMATLAKMRSLTSVQVNIAQNQQVNNK